MFGVRSGWCRRSRLVENGCAWSRIAGSRYGTVPLRFFLGITFVYAGLQKIADPGFLAPGSTTYIGTQLQAFAVHSPIGFLVDSLALPAPALTGLGVIAAELAIGVAVLLGIVTRLAAIGGALINFVFLLTASWTVQPYFLGSDGIYAVAWITLAMVGDQGILTAAPYLMRQLGLAAGVGPAACLRPGPAARFSSSSAQWPSVWCGSCQCCRGSLAPQPSPPSRRLRASLPAHRRPRAVRRGHPHRYANRVTAGASVGGQPLVHGSRHRRPWARSGAPQRQRGRVRRCVHACWLPGRLRPALEAASSALATAPSSTRPRTLQWL